MTFYMYTPPPPRCQISSHVFGNHEASRSDAHLTSPGSPFVCPSVRLWARRTEKNMFFSFFAARLDGRHRERRLSSNEDGRVA